MDSITVTNRNNIASDLYDYANTLNDDPGKHKLKALLGTGATAAGLAYLLKSKAGAPFKAKGSLITTLLSAATPAAIYYAVQNRDKPVRAVGGAGAAYLGARALSKFNGELPIADMSSEEQRRAIIKGGAGALAVALPSLYTLHHLQAARDEEKLKAIQASTANPVEKAMEINRIKTRKDMLTRYPALNMVPGASKLRKIYNEMHPPEPEVSAEDAIKYNLLPERGV